MSRVDEMIDIAGARLHFAVEGMGETLVLLHGFTGSTESMGTIAADLARDHRVVSIDLLGHGRSDAPKELERYRMEACVGDVIAVLDALGAERAHLLGYSMGGRVALAVAVHHPDRIASAVLIGASAGLDDPEARAERRRADEVLARSIEAQGVETFVEHWTALPLFASQARLPARVLEAARAQRLRNRAIGLAGSLRGLGSGAQPPLHAALQHCPVPLLFLTGEDDAKFDAIARDLAARAAHGTHTVIERAGHAAQFENPGAVIAHARRFAAAHPTHDEERTPMPPLARIPDWKPVRSYEDIRLEKAERIAKITICRPEVRNAFRPKTIIELLDAFAVVREDPEVGVVLFTGEGDLAFCSGGDQRVRGEAGYVGDDGVPRLNVLDLQKVIRSLPKPVIALVAGYAIGGGHVLHVVCDLTIAADNARFGQTGPRVGSFDGGFGSSYLARIVGQKKAREIWYLCRQYDAEQAREMGLVNTVVPLADLEATGVEWAREICGHSPLAIRCLKSAFNADCDGQAGIQELAGNATLLFYMSQEAQEGRDAYLEKRAPAFEKQPWRP